MDCCVPDCEKEQIQIEGADGNQHPVLVCWDHYSFGYPSKDLPLDYILLLIECAAQYNKPCTHPPHPGLTVCLACVNSQAEALASGDKARRLLQEELHGRSE